MFDVEEFSYVSANRSFGTGGGTGAGAGYPNQSAHTGGGHGTEPDSCSRNDADAGGFGCGREYGSYISTNGVKYNTHYKVDPTLINISFTDIFNEVIIRGADPRSPNERSNDV